jgi:hypothetical protein
VVSGDAWACMVRPLAGLQILGLGGGRAPVCESRGTYEDLYEILGGKSGPRR